MLLETTPHDTAEHLDSPEMIAGYLNAAMEDGDPALIAFALGNVLRAHGLTQLVPEAELCDEAAIGAPNASLLKLAMALKTLHVLGLHVAVAPISETTD